MSPEIRWVVKHGHRRVGRFVVVHLVAAQSEPQSISRVCVIVGRNVGNAVVRNRVRRRLREASRELLRQRPMGMDIVIRAKPAAADALFRDFVTDIAQCVSRRERESR